MQRCYGVPIEKAKQAARVEQGTLPQHALELTPGLNAKLEQCFAGQLHFCTEHEPLIALQLIPRGEPTSALTCDGGC